MYKILHRAPIHGLDGIVYRTVGTGDGNILNTIEDGLYNGYDCKRINDKLSSALDARKTGRLLDKVFEYLENFRASQKGKKRHPEDDQREEETKKNKISKHDKSDEPPNTAEPKVAKGEEPPAAKPPNSLTSLQIRLMMANAPREIEERK